MLISPEMYSINNNIYNRYEDGSISSKRRDIYISSYPSFAGLGNTPSLTLQALVVNKSVLRNSSMRLPRIERSKWIYLKSYYIFSASIDMDGRDLYTHFGESVLFPMYEMTSGYYENENGVDCVGISIFDLDSSSLMDYGLVSPMGMRTECSYLPAIDPRYYSEKEHYENLSCYPEDFMPKFQYHGQELVDEYTNMHIVDSSSVQRLTFSSSSEEAGRYMIPMIPTKSWYMNEIMQDIFSEETVGLIDSGIFIYDSSMGVGFDECRYPSIFPKQYAKENVANFLNNLRDVFRSKESLFGGNIRALYYRSDIVDVLRIISLNSDKTDPSRVMTFRVFKEDMIKDIYFRYTSQSKGVIR